RLAKKLPGPDADKLRKAFAARAGDLPAARAELAAARDAFRQALKAEPFDPARLEKSLAAMDASRAKIKQIMRTAVVAAATEMTVEGRGRLADRGQRR
ncbi:MAG: periplasmic heavy metal sensor, partial [Rhodospirillales bacterium]|nr:periplasmic heavy metal sensor [Rhodospirillales bacterium]